MIRERIDAAPTRWKRARDSKRFREFWRLGGESLKRVPRGYAFDHPLAEDLKRKDHIAAADLSPDALFSEDLVDEVAQAYRRAKNYVGFLCDALRLPM